MLETLCHPDLTAMQQHILDDERKRGVFFVKKILNFDLSVSLDATKNLCSTINRHSSHCSSMSFTTFHCVHIGYLRKLVLRVPQNPAPTNAILDSVLRSPPI